MAARTGDAAALDAFLAQRDVPLSWGQMIVSAVEGEATRKARSDYRGTLIVRRGPDGLAISLSGTPYLGEEDLADDVLLTALENTGPTLRISVAAARAWIEASGLTGPLGHVRRRPIIWFGSTGVLGSREAIEVVLGRGLALFERGLLSRIDVTLHGHGELSVCDDGDGSSLDLLPGEEPGDLRCPPEAGQEVGSGLATVRAVCERFETDVVSKGSRRLVVHEKGRCVERRAEPANGARRSTRLTLRLDGTIFRDFPDQEWLRARLVELASLHPDVRVTFRDPANPAHDFDEVRPYGVAGRLSSLDLTPMLRPPASCRRSEAVSSGERWLVDVAVGVRDYVGLLPAEGALARRREADGRPPTVAGELAPGLHLVYVNDRLGYASGTVGAGIDAALRACGGWSAEDVRSRLAIVVALRGAGISFSDSRSCVVDSPEVEPLVRDALIEAIQTATRERPEQVALALRGQTGS